MKPPGPGHWFATDEPAQSLVQRQLPALPLVQEALLQHFTLSGSDGQAPEMVTPPADEQALVVTQTPRFSCTWLEPAFESPIVNDRTHRLCLRSRSTARL